MVNDHCQQNEMSQSDYRFSRKQIRAYTGWGNTQLRAHCKRLEEMEYLLTHRGGRGQSFEYELLYDDQDLDQQKHLMGLIDIEKLMCDEKNAGLKVYLSVSNRPQIGKMSRAMRSLETLIDVASSKSESENQKCTTREKNNKVVHQHCTDNLSSLAAN